MLASTGIRSTASTLMSCHRPAVQALQDGLTVPEELAALGLQRGGASSATSAKLLARRLLGPQFQFVASEHVEVSGKKVISLSTYQEIVDKQKMARLGLAL